LHYLFRQNPVFTSLHLRSPVHVVPPLEDFFLYTVSRILLTNRSQIKTQHITSIICNLNYGAVVRTLENCLRPLTFVTKTKTIIFYR
jgi:hypothetical protein